MKGTPADKIRNSAS